MKEFEDLKIGDRGEDYGQMEGIIKAKGTILELKDYFTRGQMGYDELIKESNGLYDETSEAVAVLPDPDIPSFDSPKGSTFVYLYGPHGFHVPLETPKIKFKQ